MEAFSLFYKKIYSQLINKNMKLSSTKKQCLKDNSGMLAKLGNIARKIKFPKSWNNHQPKKFMASKASKF